MFWTRLTGKAMELAAILGLFLGISAWLLSSVVLHREFNLSKFLENTSDTNFEFSMLIGNLTSIISGGAIAVVASFITQPPIDETLETEIWEKTRDIDNPLSPWTELYIKEFSITEKKLVFNRPSLYQMREEFKVTFRTAIILGLSLTLFLL
ncbi:putative urea-proton symporter DUR3 [Apostichopus japonicus]|uniref:Putative urea-proton symporter DUR3 n=1 Tax=Stichopus japonicus TaxID=307972 RepID=A0A2G8KKH6_STIJA|nr:putative urea-proton symporter DUR3 [Apostichopus japonicus]